MNNKMNGTINTLFLDDRSDELFRLGVLLIECLGKGMKPI